jgi:hypothetical protein
MLNEQGVPVIHFGGWEEELLCLYEQRRATLHNL